MESDSSYRDSHLNFGFRHLQTRHLSTQIGPDELNTLGRSDSTPVGRLPMDIFFVCWTNV